MKILQFHSLGGASGDMILGSLFALGIDPRALKAEVAKLPIESFEIETRQHDSHNLHGTLVSVHAHDEAGHSHGHSHADHHHGVDRRWSDIREMIEGSGLSVSVRSRSLRVFERIAEAEANVHSMEKEEIHFHEVGALDSIIDIVGCCIGLDWLQVDEVAVGPLPLGCGTIECAHGVYPTPAPATVELLKGFPTTQTSEPYELVTPTGAALLTEWKTRDAPPPGSRILKVGYSFGHRQLDERPNVLRALLLEASGDARPTENCLVLECNVDDTVPELLGNLSERMLAAGALDVYTTPVQMKKQRPGTLLTALCLPEVRDRLVDLIFRECTTFGVREYFADRTVLARRHEEVETGYGNVRIKIGTWQGRDVTLAPEMDDCIQRADEKGVPVRTVYEAALQASRSLRA